MKKQYAAFHDEVVGALKAVGNPVRGKAIAADRGSKLLHLGIGFPALRAQVKQGFSFTALPPTQLLEIWDALWKHSPYGDVLFAVLEYYAPLLRKQVPAQFWPVARHWAARVDNWCHSDALSGLYSRALEANFDQVYPQLLAWNSADQEWLRRISLTSLIHYTGKNAVFLAPEQMLPLAANCVADHRKFVALALGWVLRELGHKEPRAVDAFLRDHAAHMSAPAYARAIERRDPRERARLLVLRQVTAPQ
jgi:3-methyladenine DNA glycosylase AlkD